MTDLAWRNRRTLAHRLGWPAGALAECERFDLAHPGWSAWWHPTPAADRPAGWCASMPDGPARRKRSGGWEDPTVYGQTLAELEEAMAAMEETLAAEKADEDRRWAAMRGGLR